MILTHVPGVTSCRPVSPAATSPRTGSVTGRSAVAAAVSAATTAYPSMPELSNGGSGQPAVTSSVSTPPSASSRPSSRGGSGRIAASTSDR